MPLFYFAARKMSASRQATLLVRRAAVALSARSAAPAAASTQAVRYFAGLPDSVKRVGKSVSVPNEYPGQNYEFNWALNADGVTPLKKSAFRITKPLDLKLAGLDQPKSNPLKVNAATARGLMPEAGSKDLSFDTFDDVAQSTKDALSMSDSLYCPEGHVPGTRIGVRVISNSAKLAPSLLAYLERAPRRDPTSQAITAYVYEGAGAEDFAGYAIEEIEEDGVAKSVAAVVISGSSPTIENVVAGLELSVAGLLSDEEERAKKAEEDAAEEA